jgi:uncharacterized phage protein (TIGR01671 family)
MRDDYRAWHKKHGMIYPEEYFTLEKALEGDVTFFGSPAKDYSTEDFTFMRYTGLNDKKGQRVYEGDILSYEYNNNYWAHKEKLLVVAFGEQEFADDNYVEHCVGYNIDPTEMRYYTVIGNIYENKELVPNE